MSRQSKPRYDGGMKKTWWAIGAAALGLVVSTVIAANRQVSVFENSIFELFYNIPGPFNDLVYGITQTGSLGAVLVIVVVAIIFKRRKLAALVAANAAVTYIITVLLKELVARPRPAEILSGITVRLEFATGYGFPSGHTAIATVLALTLMPYTSRKYRWLLWAWIAAVAFSRMYLGVHAPLDIIGGFCIGVIVALGGRLVATKVTTKKLKKRR